VGDPLIVFRYLIVAAFYDGVVGGDALEAPGGRATAGKYHSLDPGEPRGFVDVVRADEVPGQVAVKVRASQVGRQVDDDIDVLERRPDGL